MSVFLKRTIERTEAKRRAVAEALLSWDAIVAKIGEAAAAGDSKVTLTPTAPIKIRHTDAAAAAVERLTRERFRALWIDHRPATGVGPTGDQLEIEWAESA